MAKCIQSNLAQCLSHTKGFLGGAVVKNGPADAGDTGLISGSGRSPGGGNDNPLQYFCLENAHGQRSLMGYSPWHRKELDMIQALGKGYTI